MSVELEQEQAQEYQSAYDSRRTDCVKRELRAKRFKGACFYRLNMLNYYIIAERKRYAFA